MDSIQSLKPNDQIDNTKLCELFKCGTQGGMRRSHKTGTLVLVTNRAGGVYKDSWFGDVLHYTGMGLTGPQSLDASQNKTLNQSRTNGVRVHLFEVFMPTVYTYKGEVELVTEPYQELQQDSEKQERTVWVFPVRLKSSESAVTPSELIEQSKMLAHAETRRRTDEDVELRARMTAKAKIGFRNAQVKQYERSEWVAESAKRRAKGMCQLCLEVAPFADAKGRPYLETHHIVWLAKDGPDTVENTVALCPNCHRRMHVLALDSDIQVLLERNASVGSPKS